MNIKIFCNIEYIYCAKEDVCFVSVDWKDLDNAIVLFSAFRLDIIDRLKLINKERTCSVCINKLQTNRINTCVIQIEHNKYEIPSYWLDAILSMLTRSRVNGWSATDHLDCELTNSNKQISLCISVDLQ